MRQNVNLFEVASKLTKTVINIISYIIRYTRVLGTPCLSLSDDNVLLSGPVESTPKTDNYARSLRGTQQLVFIALFDTIQNSMYTMTYTSMIVLKITLTIFYNEY